MPRMIELRVEGSDVLLPVKVVPGASRDRVVGEFDGALKVTVAAAPEKGAANAGICRLLARSLGIRTRQVEVIAGHTHPRKTVRLSGVTAGLVREKLLGGDE